MAFDERKIKYLKVDNGGIVTFASLIYISNYTTTEIEPESGDVTTATVSRKSFVQIDTNGIAGGNILFQNHISDVQTDYSSIIGQPLVAVLATFSLTVESEQIEVT